MRRGEFSQEMLFGQSSSELSFRNPATMNHEVIDSTGLGYIDLQEREIDGSVSNGIS
jgi:hypothetical protein